MRRFVLTLPLLALLLPGCKKVDELEAALADAQKQLGATQAELDREKQKNSELQAENESLQSRMAQLDIEIKGLNDQIEQLAKNANATKAELDELRAEKAKREAELAVYRQLINDLRSLVDAGTIKLKFRKGRLTVELANAILFDSGSAKLKKEGKQALADLSTALKKAGQRDFLIAGHTDNIPMKSAKFANNWELSSGRAITVVKSLEENGMNPKMLGAAGFAEHDPVGDNASKEGRAENRRIEIILMPKLGEIPGMKEMLMNGGKS